MDKDPTLREFLWAVFGIAAVIFVIWALNKDSGPSDCYRVGSFETECVPRDEPP